MHDCLCGDRGDLFFNDTHPDHEMDNATGFRPKIHLTRRTGSETAKTKAAVNLENLAG